ncbi:VanZ family protein [candidate division WOR-3 bacterium]|nr:VanZ family protein [candidate division WOR-3 bacterium]
MNQRVRVILLIVWIVTIFVLTGYPGLKAPRFTDFPIDKAYHFIAFVLLGIFEIRLVKNSMYFLIGCNVAILAELQQLLIPGRDFEYLDIVAGMCGLCVVFAAYKGRKMVRHDVSKT